MRRKSIIITIFIALYDQVIKHVINSTFYYGELKTVISNVFYITKVYNDGAAWSTFSGNRVFLIGITLVAFVFLIWLERSFEASSKLSIAFGLIYGGLIGNFIDRVMYGHVIDYLKVMIGEYEFPIFNLADVTIVVGFIIIIIGILKGEDKVGNNNRKRELTDW